MDILIRAFEAYVVVVCVLLIMRRYRRTPVKIVPADVLLWTIGLFFVMPLAMNVYGVRVNYQAFPALQAPFEDSLVRGLAAAGTLLAVVITVWFAVRAQKTEVETPPLVFTRRRRRLWLIASFLPAFVAWRAPRPEVYDTFAAAFVLRGPGQAFADPTGAVAQYHVFVSWSAYLSCIAFAVWFSSGQRTRKTWVLAGLVGYMNLWLLGKRHIVAMLIILLVFAAASGKTYNRRQVQRGARRAFLGFAAVIAISSWYQTTYRPHVADNDQQLESFVIDFGRQDVLRLAIAGHVGPHVSDEVGREVGRPLGWPGHSLYLHAEQTLPGIGSEDTIGYADRVTSVGYGEPFRQQSGSITTSVFSETVDNIGLAGLVVGPLLLGWLAMLASFRHDPLLRITGALAACTLAVVHVLAVLPVVGLFGLRLLWLSMGRLRRPHANRRPMVRRTHPPQKRRPLVRKTYPSQPLVRRTTGGRPPAVRR